MYKRIYNFLGPGILLTATAVGVSHLVQSVQAGAKFGYLFIVFIFLAHLIKLPFFEIAPRYSAITKKSLLSGYNDLGKKYIWLYFFITLSSTFTIIAAVSVVAGGIFANIMPFHLDIKIWASIALSTCYIILLIGKYSFLDKIIKPIILSLLITTVIAVIFSYNADIIKLDSYKNNFSFLKKTDILFLIAFLGWMPCPLDCSVWNSIWIEEKYHLHKQDVSLKNSILDFRIGFFSTAILAILFLLLGNIIFYGTDTQISSKSIVFLNQFFLAYTTNLGNGVFWIVAITAFFTMFSTVITCLDGSPRVFTRIFDILLKEKQTDWKKENIIYIIMLTISFFGGLIIINCFFSNMKHLIFLATSISFVTAPIIAFLNLKLLKSDHYPKQYLPKKYFFYYSYFSLFVLIAFVMFFIYNIL